jgi:glycosyltransferase involved in cell wall biosynthesis
MQDNSPIENTLTPPSDLKFYIDVISDTVVSGWVSSTNDLEKCFSVKLLIDGLVAGERVADDYREDVKAAGFSNGYCGYVFNVPKGSIRTAEQVIVVVDEQYEFRANNHTTVRLTELPSKKIVKSKSDQPVIWLDITDFIIFVFHHVKVSGIQRVQAGLSLNILANKNTGLKFKFCVMNVDDSDFYEISAFNLKAILSALPNANNAKLAEWRDFVKKATAIENNLPMSFDEKDCLVLLGAIWAYNDQARRILDVKRKSKVRMIQVIYDLIPILKQEVVIKDLRDAFAKAIFTSLVYADGFLTISKYTTAEFRKFIEQQNISDIPPILEFSMGTELSYSGEDDTESYEIEDISETVAEALENPFVLFVSTIEIRKNHAYVFRVWQRLLEQYGDDKIPNLVFVGRRGWLVDDLFAQLNNSENLGGKVIILSDISDIELKALYENCQFTVYPSTYEGWGLPVSESLNYGKVCVASNLTSIPEAGGDLAIYFDPYDLNAGYRVVEELLFNPALLKEREAMIRELYRPVSWKAATDSLIDGIQYILAQLPAPAIQKSAASELLPLPTVEIGKRYHFFRNLNDIEYSKLSVVERWRNDAISSQILQRKWNGRLRTGQ